MRYAYTPYVFAVNLANIEKIIEDYHRLQNYPNTCLGNTADEPCRQCIETCLGNIAKILTDLLSIGPSWKISEELDDFRKLSRLEKKFFEIEGRMGHFVYVLMDRKYRSLEGSSQARKMSRKHWKNTEWTTEEQGMAGYQGLGRSREMKRTVQRLQSVVQGDPLFVRPEGGGEISGLPECMVALQEAWAEGRAESAEPESSFDEEEQWSSEDSEDSDSTSSMMDYVAAETPSNETSHPSPTLDLIDDNPYEGSGEDTTSPPRDSEGSIFDVVERDPATTTAPAPRELVGDITNEVSEQGIHPPPRSFNSIGIPPTEVSSPTSSRIPATALEDERRENPPRRIDFNIFEREPSEVRTPAPPGLSVAAPTRSVIFDVVEREPREVRAPVPPVLRF
ncbi:MAG: hypothetical protein Q9200_004617 [Gallowayella weberi]